MKVKVKEIIELLQKCDGEAEFHIGCQGYLADVIKVVTTQNNKVVIYDSSAIEELGLT